MKNTTVSNFLIIIVFLLLIATVIYGIVRIDKESFDCIYNPIEYYEKTNNVTIPRMIKQEMGIATGTANLSEVNFTINYN